MMELERDGERCLQPAFAVTTPGQEGIGGSHSYYVSIRMLMDEIHKIVHPQTDSKATDEYILDNDENDVTRIIALSPIPSTENAEETLSQRDVASSIQLISPFQVNAFTSYI